MSLAHRLATSADLPELRELMRASIRELIAAHLDPERVEASFALSDSSRAVSENIAPFKFLLS